MRSMSTTISKKERATRRGVTVPLLDLKTQYRSIKREIDEAVQEVLESHNWNRNATADSLGVNRTTLYKKMKKLGLES